MVGAIGRWFSRNIYDGPSVSQGVSADAEHALLHSEAEQLWGNSRLRLVPLQTCAERMAQHTLLHSLIPITEEIYESLIYLWKYLLEQEGLHAPDKLNDINIKDAYADLAIRQHLKSQINFLSNDEDNLTLLSECIETIASGIGVSLSEELFSHSENPLCFEARLIDLLDQPIDVINGTLSCIFSEEMKSAGLLKSQQKLIEQTFLRISGINSRTALKQLVYPGDYPSQDGEEVLEAYLGNTPFKQLFTTQVPLQIPEQSRFEHCHIVGGTGHGKTQLLQHLISQDIEKAREDKQSVVVIDSQGEMIEKIRRLSAFDHEGGALAKRLVVIDPYEVEYPPSLNLFSINKERLEQYNPAEQERIFNGIVELYETFFGSLLGAEMTQKQGVLFSFLARLMLEIPNASIHTLQEVMQEGERFRPYIERLEGAARYFFEDEFFSRSFAATKTQIARRLYGVLSIPAFERMFGARENKLDIFELLNQGSIILISTAKDLMKSEGSALFGRFFIASITQAVLERSVLHQSERTPVHLYIDEAQEYLDENIETLLNQARKYKCGVHIAHQHLDQLSTRLRSTLAANTSIKCIGGLSAKDSSAFASEVGMPSDEMRGLRKTHRHTEFALWVKHTTPRAIPIQVPLGYLEQQDQMTEEALSVQLDFNRSLYQAPASESYRREFKKKEPTKAPPQETVVEVVETTPEPTTLKPAIIEEATAEEIKRNEEQPPTNNETLINPKVPGRGKKEHKYLQELVRNLGMEYGYKAVVEAPLQAGGAVDILLSKDTERIALEIALNTATSYELHNISKSLNEGIDSVIVISTKPKHLANIKERAEAEFSKDQFKQLRFISPELLPEILTKDEHTERIRGYKVKVKRSLPSQEEILRKREKIASILSK